MSKIATRVQTLATEPVAANIAKGAALTHEELDDNFYYLNVTTNGTVEANKAIIAGTGGNITSVGTIGCGAITSTGTSAFGDITVGGGYGSTGITVSAAGVIQANGAITSDGAITGGSLTDGVATLDGAGALTGLTNLVVDNITINGNDITAGTGNLTLTSNVTISGANSLTFSSGGAAIASDGAGQLTLSNIDVIDAATEAAIKAEFLANDGDTGTGAYDFGGATSFEIPNGATNDVTVDGQIGIDTSVTDLSHGLLQYYGGEKMGVVAMPIAQYTTPTNGYVVAYNSTSDEFELVANSAGGDVTGPGTSTDNAVARYDGTGNVIQNSGVIINDSDQITAGEWTATDVAVAHGGTGASTAADARDNLDTGCLISSVLTNVLVVGSNDGYFWHPAHKSVSPSAGGAETRMYIPRDGVIYNMTVHNTVDSSNGSWDIAVAIDGTVSALKVTFPGNGASSNTTLSNTSDEVSVSAGQYLSVEFNPNTATTGGVGNSTLVTFMYK